MPRILPLFRTAIKDAFGAGSAPAVARASFWLLATGGVLGLVSTALPSERSRNAVAAVLTSALALVLSLVPGTAFRRLRPVAYELLCAAGTVLVSVGLYVGGTNADDVFYFWVS